MIFLPKHPKISNRMQRTSFLAVLALGAFLMGNAVARSDLETSQKTENSAQSTLKTNDKAMAHARQALRALSAGLHALQAPTSFAGITRSRKNS